jgi:hypothetical protein
LKGHLSNLGITVDPAVPLWLKFQRNITQTLQYFLFRKCRRRLCRVAKWIVNTNTSTEFIRNLKLCYQFMSLGLRYLSPLTNTSRREVLLIILMSPVITWPAWGTCTRIFSEKIKTFLKFLTRFCSIPINVIVSNVLTFFSSTRGTHPHKPFPNVLKF